MVIGGTEGILTVEEGEDLIDPLSLGEMVRIRVPNILAGLLTIVLIGFLPHSRVLVHTTKNSHLCMILPIREFDKMNSNAATNHISNLSHIECISIPVSSVQWDC